MNKEVFYMTYELVSDRVTTGSMSKLADVFRQDQDLEVSVVEGVEFFDVCLVEKDSGRVRSRTISAFEDEADKTALELTVEAIQFHDHYGVFDEAQWQDYLVNLEYDAA